MQLYISVLTFTLISVIAVSGVYVLTGLTGMFSLGQAAFMAIGAYVSGALVVKAGLPFALAALGAVILSTLVGFLVGLPTVRLRRDYISLVTLGFGEAITALLNQTQSITGGALGFSGIPKLTTFGLTLASAFVCIFMIGCLKRSKYGRQCIAVKNDELAAKAMGINVPRIKMTAFLVSVAITSYAGVLYAFYTTYVEPSVFGWKKSAEWVIMVFFGGVNSLTGSIFSTVILTALPEMLRFAAEYRVLFYGILVILIINFKPSGIFGEYELPVAKMLRLFKRDAKRG